MYNDKDILNKFQDIAFIQNILLDKNGISKFGMLCKEDHEVLGYCYQKDGVFVFLNYKGEEVESPLCNSPAIDIFRGTRTYFKIRRYLVEKGQFTKLLRYDEDKLLYTICIPSNESCTNIYPHNGEYYLVCKDGRSVHLCMYCSALPYFEYIDKHRYIHLAFHIPDQDECVRDNRGYEGSLSDVICIKETSEFFVDSEIISYKNYKIICSQEPNCTIVFTDGMDEIYRRGESSVFCQVGQYAYVIFENAQLAYNIDEAKEVHLEGLGKYDNYDVGLGYLVRYQEELHSGEENICEDDIGLYIEPIPRHDLTTAYVYNCNLELVNEIKVAGIFNGLVDRRGRIMLWFSIEGESPKELYYDIYCENEIIYDDSIHHYYTSPNIIEDLPYKSGIGDNVPQ